MPVIFVRQISFLHKLHFHVMKRPINIKSFKNSTLITMTCLNLKNSQKMSQRILGIKLAYEAYFVTMKQS